MELKLLFAELMHSILMFKAGSVYMLTVHNFLCIFCTF